MCGFAEIQNIEDIDLFTEFEIELYLQELWNDVKANRLSRVMYEKTA